MKAIIGFIKKFYIRFSGYSYTHLGRLFLRLFVGIMLLQFGVRQLAHYFELVEMFPEVLGMSSATSLTVLICIEIICSLFIMTGFITRLMILPPFAAMCTAAYYLLHTSSAPFYLLSWQQPAYLPVMFLGIYFFLLLVGPGKISVDYFLSLHIIHADDKSEAELEEV